MNFANLFRKSNSSICQLQGSILKSTIEQKNQNRILLDAGMRNPLLCLEDELCTSSFQQTVDPIMFKTSSKGKLLKKGVNPFLTLEKSFTFQYKVLHQTFQEKPKSTLNLKEQPQIQNVELGLSTQNTKDFKRKLTEYSTQGRLENSLDFLVGVEQKRSFFTGDFLCIPPKSMDRISRRKLVWTELSKQWRAGMKNRIKGFILNSVNGGYAVALAGYIAFLPKSLCLTKKIFLGQWRQFAIIGMNPKIANIVVKETRGSLGTIRNKVKRRNMSGVDRIHPFVNRISLSTKRVSRTKAEQALFNANPQQQRSFSNDVFSSSFHGERSSSMNKKVRQ